LSNSETYLNLKFNFKNLSEEYMNKCYIAYKNSGFRFVCGKLCTIYYDSKLIE